jgi:hypothetical protein
MARGEEEAMNDLEEITGGELAPYERGVSLREAIQGALTRFLPGSVAGLLGILAYGGFPNFLANLPGYVGLVGSLTLGFGLGLEAMRRWLYPDAKVNGGRSLVAGLMGGPLWFAWIALGPSIPGLLGYGVFVLFGLVLALLMFFAWFTPTPEHMRDDRRLESGSLEPLAPASLPIDAEVDPR